MNYCEIGQKIRKYRKVRGYSQEQLSEQVNISVTHLSHIETGNTKLSLPVLVAISKVLDIQTDDLLSEKNSGRNTAIGELSSVLDACSTQQIRIITDTVKALKESLDKYGDIEN